MLSLLSIFLIRSGRTLCVSGKENVFVSITSAWDRLSRSDRCLDNYNKGVVDGNMVSGENQNGTDWRKRQGDKALGGEWPCSKAGVLR